MEKNTRQYGIAIIGPDDMISGFRALGVTAINAETAKDVIETLKEMKKNVQRDDIPASEKFAVVLVVEEFIKDIPADEYARLSEGALPAVIALPGITGSTGFGEERLRRITERAIGSDIL